MIFLYKLKHSLRSVLHNLLDFRHSLTMIYYFIRILTKSMRLKQKLLFQSVLMIAYFDSCFRSKTLKNKLKAQNRKPKQLHCKTLFPEHVLLLKTSGWLLLDTALEGLRFNCLSYLIL